MASSSIERLPFGSFHRRLAVYANGGLFCDGYILSGFGFALGGLQHAIPLSPAMEGLVAAAPLVGIFVGGIVFGYVTDLVGRRTMFLGDLLAFVIASVLLVFVTAPAELVVLRFVLGVAIGADYAIAAALIGEFTPMRQRGAALASMQVAWFLGALASFVVGALLAGAGPDGWRFILGSSAVPAALALLLRRTAPESPRWLLARGRTEEAREALQQAFGGDATLDDLAAPPSTASTPNAPSGPDARMVAFIGIMWLLQVTPFFAIYTFEPQVLEALRLTRAATAVSSVAITAFFLVGSVLGMRLIETWGRRPLAIASFAASAIAFAVLASVSGAGLVAAAFVFYALAMGPAFSLELVYPAECFPTQVRATGVGVAAAISRVGAAAGTFALPIALVHFGIPAVMWLSCALSAIGVLVTLRWAPETKGLTLVESSATRLR